MGLYYWHILKQSIFLARHRMETFLMWFCLNEINVDIFRLIFDIHSTSCPYLFRFIQLICPKVTRITRKNIRHFIAAWYADTKIWYDGTNSMILKYDTLVRKYGTLERKYGKLVWWYGATVSTMVCWVVRWYAMITQCNGVLR